MNCLNPIAACGMELLPDTYEITDNYADADAVLVRSASMHDLELSDKLLCVARAGAGVNNIPLDKCAEKGVVVFNTPGANANGVKELVVAGLLLASRDLMGGYNWVKDNASDENLAKAVEKQKKQYAGNEIAGKKLAIVPILRAGLGMVDGILALVPSARVGHIGKERAEVTHEPHEYYCKMPKDIDQRICLVVDPMLATGGSAEMAISYLRERGVKDIRMLCIGAAPEGLKSLTEKDPDVHIYTCAIDDHLNEAAYIVPGLGDAGDRIYGTK